MKIKLGELRHIIKEVWWAGKLPRSTSSGGFPPVGSWIMFQQHGPDRFAEPVMITDVTDDDVEITWGQHNYSMRVPRDEVEHRENQEVLNADDPRVLASTQSKKEKEASVDAVYGGDPRKKPRGLGT